MPGDIVPRPLINPQKICCYSYSNFGKHSKTMALLCTNVVCWRHHEYYQLPLNLTTQNPSVLSPNSTLCQYFIYFIVSKVNLKLVLSWNWLLR